MKKWITLAAFVAVGLLLPLSGTPGSAKNTSSTAPADTSARFQLVDAHFENAFLQNQGGIVKIDTVTGESWRYMAIDGLHFYWVPIETLKEVPKIQPPTVKATWKNLDSQK